MEHQVIVCKAFGLPGSVQGILGYGLAVYIDVDMLSLGGVVGLCIPGEPALNTPALIVVRSGALFAEIISYLEPIYVKLAHIVPDAVKVLD